MIASGIGPGDEVITTPMTFCATANAIIHTGATPVLADVDPQTMNIDPAAIEAAVTPRTRAILPVHFAGRPCDMDAILAIAERHGLQVIEDCAHAIETEYHGRKAGTFGSFGCFSFYVTKNVTTGEGGMVVAKAEADIARIKTLALHGMTKDAWHRFSDKGFRHYRVAEAGFKYNMMDLQAAIGIHQLAASRRSWQRRQEIWERYQEAFSDLPVTCPADPEPNTRHGLHLYTLLIDESRMRHEPGRLPGSHDRAGASASASTTFARRTSLLPGAFRLAHRGLPDRVAHRTPDRKPALVAQAHGRRRGEGYFGRRSDTGRLTWSGAYPLSFSPVAVK